MLIAEKDKEAFILSNDRYAEYHDYDVVRSNRVIRHMIAEGRIMSKDLDVSAKF